MKRYLAFLAVLLLILGLIACADGEQEDVTTSPDPSLTDGPSGTSGLPTLRIGALFTLSGDGAAIGESQRNAMHLWLDERDWQIGPYQIILNYRDDQSSAETAVAGTQELVETGADLLFGGHLIAVCRAIGEIAIISGVPYIIPATTGDDMTQRGRNDLLIRTGGSSSQATHPFGYWAHSMHGIQTVGIIAADSTFAHESVAGFMRTFEESGGEVLGVPVWVPANVSHFVSFLDQVPREAEALFIQFEGADTKRVLEAVRDMDWERGDELIILAGWARTDELILADLNPSAAIGSYFASPWLPTDARAAAFAQAFESRFGQVPRFHAMEAYAALDILEAAILEADGFADNFEAFLQAIRNIEFVSPKGILTIDEWNNVVQDIHIRQVPPDGTLRNTPVHTFSAVSQFWRYDPEEFLALPVYDRSFNTEVHNRLLDDMRLYPDEDS